MTLRVKAYEDPVEYAPEGRVSDGDRLESTAARSELGSGVQYGDSALGCVEEEGGNPAGTGATGGGGTLVALGRRVITSRTSFTNREARAEADSEICAENLATRESRSAPMGLP